jgi:two-component system, sensor histidine kinase RegB
MDRPLLALTRPRAAPGPADDDAATGNMRQLVQLRWIAVAGQLVTIMVVGVGLGIRLPLGPMLLIVAALALANLLATLALPRHRVRNGEIMLALLLDMGALTGQLYLSGGATNPFIALYLLQVVLGAILLETWSVWVLVLATSGCYALLGVAHVPLALPPGLAPRATELFLVGDWLGFAMAATLLVLFITRISRNLRARDAHVADLRQRAAEQDGIVRMGLFASGAAHELGTPLATLSVILADWQRIPRLADDPEIGPEIAEMQAELGRCKAIVTDILHSAGRPRGEPMEAADARLFLSEVADAWCQAHPAVPLALEQPGLAAARIVADPALRQAVFNLLDNAAEVSPAGVTLRTERRDDTITVAVRDAGPGFPPALLDRVGRPGETSKGAGHGVGLFLASNVARRLGGRLEAENLPAGGAEVRLVLPLAGDAPEPA